jgi:cytochrome d ubiquinol oxidase subunit I
MTALGIYIHGFFLLLAVGLPYLVLTLEGLGIKRQDNDYLRGARSISSVWAISFGFGAITGTLVEFGLYQIWPGTMLVIGSFWMIPVYFDLLAFLLEVAFLVAYLQTWDRFSNRWYHWLLGFGVLIGSNFSAVAILAANAWMQTPWGTGGLIHQVLPWVPALGPSVVNEQAYVQLQKALQKSGSAILADRGAIQALGYLLYDQFIVLSNPNAYATSLHTILATIMIAAFENAAVFSYSYLRGNVQNRTFYLRNAKFSYGFGGATAFLQALAGDQMARIVYQFQYLKFLALEGIGGRTGPDPAMGIMLYLDPRHIFAGFGEIISSAAQSTVPEAVIQSVSTIQQYEGILHITYYAMVISGAVLMIFGVAFLGLRVAWIDRVVRFVTRSPTERFVIISSFAAPIVALVAGVSGWFVREVGRHPWTIYGIVTFDKVATTNPITLGFGLLIIGVELAVLATGLAALYFVPTRSLQKEEIVIIRAG